MLVFDSVERCMAYFLKPLSYLIELPGVLVLLIVLFFIIFRRRMTRVGRIFVLSICVSLYFISSVFVARLLVFPLEGSSEPIIPDDAWVPLQEGCIVVLGGGAVRDVPDTLRQNLEGEIGPASLKRVHMAYRIYHRIPYPLILSGGSVFGGHAAVSESEFMARALQLWGVPREDIVLEERSRNTRENALYTLERLPDEVSTIYLVTSAIHMRRARLVFHRTLARLERSVEITSICTNYTLSRGSLRWFHFFPTRNGMISSLAAVHEYLGLLFYAVFY